jgi:hypothetical protein
MQLLDSHPLPGEKLYRLENCLMKRSANVNEHTIDVEDDNFGFEF